MRRIVGSLLVVGCVVLLAGCERQSADEVMKDERAADEKTVDESAEAPQGETHYRDARWGMSPQEVKQTEKGDLFRERERVILFDTDGVLGLSAKAGYVFVEDKLVRGKYIFTEPHTNNNAYIKDYRSLKKALNQKYGDPKSDSKNWLNDLYRDDRSQWGMAVATGDLNFFTTWETDETIIKLFLHGDNYDINLEIAYVSKELEELEDEAREEEASEAL